MAEDGAKRRGRPPIPEEERKGANLTFRTRGSLRLQLEAAAQEAGRSVSEEIEHRLQISFDRKAVALQVFGEQNASLISALQNIVSMPQSSQKHANSAIYLAAITTILAVSGSDLEGLLEKNVDPSVWLFLSQSGIMRASNLDIDAASEEAERVVPEMASKMAEYRAGVEMARRLKQERSK